MTIVAFDFDGTLSRSDVSLLLAQEADVAGTVRGLVEQGIRGDVDFETSLRQRVELLAGLPQRKVDAAFERVRLREGVPALVGGLREAGVHVAIISGGFEGGILAGLDRAGVAVDSLVANQLLFANGALTGDIDGPLVGRDKDEALGQVAVDAGVSLDETIAVGSGAMDLPMLQVAGTAIGYDPAAVVEPHCDAVVHSIRRLRLYFEQHGVL